MKKNSDKNLTSRQRKEQRQSQATTKREVVQSSQTQNTVESEEQVAYKPRMSANKRLAIIIGVIIAEAIIIFLAIFLPITISPYRDTENPVAVITLSNGMELEFEIFEKDVPYAATNFIYLANNKYFEGAIIYDMQNYFVRFGGFTDEFFAHRSDDLEFAKKITDITPREDGRKFVYRLKSDTSSRAKEAQEDGYLSFIINSSTEFQICAMQNASYGSYNSISFARYYSEDTLNKIHELYAFVYPENSEPLVHTSTIKPDFKIPNTIIKIEKVKVYNLDREKWRNFNYMDYLTQDKHLSYWSG